MFWLKSQFQVQKIASRVFLNNFYFVIFVHIVKYLGKYTKCQEIRLKININCKLANISFEKLILTQSKHIWIRKTKYNHLSFLKPKICTCGAEKYLTLINFFWVFRSSASASDLRRRKCIKNFEGYFRTLFFLFILNKAFVRTRKLRQLMSRLINL